MTSLCEVKWLDNNGCKNLLHMFLPPKLATGILRSLDPMKKFRRRNRGNNGLHIDELAKKSGHIEFPPIICDQNRRVEN
jgi:hypothetical protein